MSAAPILDRLSRVKAVRPGSWMAACPCCESRKGRPLAVTEKDDGRVLLHAFCGCSTADVLARLGLEITDLFEQSIAMHMTPVRPRVPAAEVLDALTTESLTVALIAAQLLETRSVDEETWARLAQASNRIINARDYIHSK